MCVLATSTAQTHPPDCHFQGSSLYPFCSVPLFRSFVCLFVCSFAIALRPAITQIALAETRKTGCLDRSADHALQLLAFNSLPACGVQRSLTHSLQSTVS